MDINAFTEKMKNRLEAKYAGKFQIYTDELSSFLYWDSADKPYTFLIFKIETKINNNKLGGRTSELEVYNFSFDMENKDDVCTKKLNFNCYKITEKRMEAQIFKSMKQVYNIIQNIVLLKKQKWVHQRKKEIELEFSDD